MLLPSPSSMRAAATTPAEPADARVARFPAGGSLPRQKGGSASALLVSGPAQRSLALQPAWSLSRPRRPRYIGVLQAMSLPPSPAPIATGWSDSCRAGFAPARRRRLSTAHMWTPPAVQEGIRTTRDMRSGTVVCPASQVRHACAAGPYGVRGSDPNRFSGMLDSPACRVGFSDPVSLTFCPYVVFRPNRTVRDHPRITASNRHPRSPVFEFRTAHFSSKQLFPSSGSRHRCPVTFLLDRQRPDDARHLVRQCDGD